MLMGMSPWLRVGRFQLDGFFLGDVVIISKLNILELKSTIELE
jgi:hypothetical protein